MPEDTETSSSDDGPDRPDGTDATAQVQRAAREVLAPRREPGLVVEPNRPDFPALVARAWLSVSQAGYNTVVDVLAARARSVLVPFAAEGETEQSLRAAALAARGLATVVNEAELTPQMLSRAIDTTAAAPRPSHDIALDGARAVLADNAGHPGHIFNLGHGVQPDTDPGVLAAVVDYVHEGSTQ